MENSAHPEPEGVLSGTGLWVADDDRAIRFVLKRALERAGADVCAFASGTELLHALEGTVGDGAQSPDVVVTDIRMPGISGLELVETLTERLPDAPVLVMTAFSDLESAVSSYRSGAFEYLTKPFDVEKVVELVRRAAEEAARRRKARRSDAQTDSPTGAQDPRALGAGLIGSAPAMQEVFRAIGRLSQSAVTVLLTGESGAGKEVVARALWKHSPRSQKPFVALNMAAIPKELLESELFGHERGAFTGATATRPGRFEQAAGGTLFLDEIGDMPAELQTRLLRVLSSGTYYRVGGREAMRADVRVIAATNRDLEAAVRDGTFREDLYHRLNVIRLRLPPLRERREDVGALAEHFLSTGAAELGLELKTLSPKALAALERFPFPGNVRQLENICRWLLVMAPAREIRLEDLPYEVQRPEGAADRSASAGTASGGADWVDWGAALEAHCAERLAAGERHLWERVTDRVESILIRTALVETKGRRIEAAERLGVGRNTLTRKIRTLGMED